METSNRIWTTANGDKIPFGELTQQHISNILWFMEVFNNLTEHNSAVMGELSNELLTRFVGGRLSWRPLPISNEVKWLENMGLIKGKHIVFKNQIIGTIEHIV